MLIAVVHISNSQPTITVPQNVALQAGQMYQGTVQAEDADGDATGLELYGELSTVANFTLTQSLTAATALKKTFTWQPQCNDIRKEPYRVVVKALDQTFPSQLSNFHSFLIYVKPPTPVQPQVALVENGLKVSWNQIKCISSDKNRMSVRVYRTSNCDRDATVPDYLIPNDYTLIAERSGDDTSFVDSIPQTGDYSYFLVTDAKSATGEITSSLLSSPACASVETVGVENAYLGSSILQFFPNPFKSTLTFRYPSQSGNLVRLEVLDLTGHTWCDHSEAPSMGEHHMEIKVDHLPEGMYVYRFTSGEKTFTGKIIKQ